MDNNKKKGLDKDREYWTRDVAPPNNFIDLEQQSKTAEEFLKEYAKRMPQPEDYLKGYPKTDPLRDDDQLKKGYKESDNKPDYSEINLNILDLMAERFNANKHKYPKGNMLKPLDNTKLCWAALRHIKKMIKVQDGDPETFEDHLSATLCNMSMVLDQLEIERKEKIFKDLIR